MVTKSGLPEIGSSVERAVDFLRGGEVVAIPTETVYGLAADAFNEDAILKIYRVKGRPRFNPLIFHVASLGQVEELVTEFPKSFHALTAAFWPGPLTLVLGCKRRGVSEIATAGLPTVAVRMPSHPLALATIEKLGKPIVAPSANPSGYISPTTPEMVQSALAGKIPYILDGGPTQIGIESTIVSLAHDPPVLLRPGFITPFQLRSYLPDLTIPSLDSMGSPIAPGQLKTHYAPRKPLFLLSSPSEIHRFRLEETGILDFHGRFSAFQEQVGWYKDLSPTGSDIEAAKNLFSSLRAFDEAPVKQGVTMLLPETELGIAINDRLIRATTPIE
jgi:L-threonylcarbamoyladenylate synthase